MDGFTRILFPRIKSGRLLLSIEEYRKRFRGQMGKRGKHTLTYFDSMSKPRSGDVVIGMLHFPNFKTEWVPGGPWPGHYAMYHITDYRKATDIARKKKISMEDGMRREDFSDTYKVVPYPLKTTERNILEEIKRKRYSLFNIPPRFFKKYQKKLLMKIGDTVCQDSNLTKEMLDEVLREMTPAEKSIYEQSLYKIDVSLYPSVELPVRVRITGIDDGAEESLFPSVEKAKDIMNEIAVFNMADTRRTRGFQSCD